MSDGAYTRSDFPTTSSHRTFVVGNSDRVYVALQIFFYNQNFVKILKYLLLAESIELSCP